MPLKITHLGKYYYPAAGGIETHLRTLALAQAEAGHQVEVFCFNHQASQTTEIFMDGKVKVHRFGVPYSFARIAYCADLTKALTACDADVLHLQVPNPSMILSYVVSRLTQKITEAPLVVTYQSDHVNQPLRGLLFRPVETYFYSLVDKIIATSESYRQSSPLLRRFQDKVTVVPLGIPTTALRNPTAAQKKSGEEIRKHYGSPTWITCSRLVPYKGIQYAVRAMKEAPGHLLILGDGPERDNLRTLSEKLNLTDRVHFLGFQADLVPYLLGATALWLPSINRAEAFGIIQVEAMATGLPVINCRIEGSGVAEVSVDGESGFTVALEDPSAIAAAATRLHENPELRATFSQNALARATKKYDISLCLNQILEVYGEVTSKRKVPQIGPTTFKSAEMTTKVAAEKSQAQR